jgi:hypothetical protein
MPSSVDHGPATGTQTGTQTCRFSIKATNDRDVDVVVMLYDSRVYGSIYNRQLKIQNYRIAPGKSMDVRYEAPGGCSAKRSWTFYTRRGGWDGTKGFMGYKTSGDTTDGRTINLGRTSAWPFQG